MSHTFIPEIQPLHLTFNLYSSTLCYTVAMSPFPEEQLDSPLGYFPAQLGQTLQDNTWTITRKLGWGPRSSTWLVVNKDDQYYALKILTAAASADPNSEREADFLFSFEEGFSSGLPDLRETFGEEDELGREHLCLLFMLLGTSVEDLRQGNVYNEQKLPVHIVQKVIGDISGRLHCLATQNIIHGGTSESNYFIIIMNMNIFYFSCNTRQLPLLLRPTERRPPRGLRKITSRQACQNSRKRWGLVSYCQVTADPESLHMGIQSR